MNVAVLKDHKRQLSDEFSWYQNPPNLHCTRWKRVVGLSGDIYSQREVQKGHRALKRCSYSNQTSIKSATHIRNNLRHWPGRNAKTNGTTLLSLIWQVCQRNSIIFLKEWQCSLLQNKQHHQTKSGSCQGQKIQAKQCSVCCVMQWGVHGFTTR